MPNKYYMANQARNLLIILAFKKRKKYSEIAKDLNVTIGVVAGVLFRYNHPLLNRRKCEKVMSIK